jgi:hypothetical protein
MLNKRLLLLPLLLIALLFFFHQPLLTGMGNWLAPAGEPVGEAAVLEGTQVVIARGVAKGVALLREGKVKYLYLVLHLFPTDRRLFAIQEEYAGYLGKELENLGVKRGQYRVLLAPIEDHPITLSEARYVVPVLGRERIKKAVLLAEGFHTRRSWRVYQRVGKDLRVEFVPYPYFSAFPEEQWWRHVEGVKEFVGESVKWGYYLVMGYL